MAALASAGVASSFAAGGRLRNAASNGSAARVSAMKKDIHPKFYNESKVFCNGVEVMCTSGTKSEYIVDVWSGNHPFYQGQKSTIIVDDGRVSRFNKMFPDLLATMGNVQTLTGSTGDAESGAPVKAGPKQARAAKKPTKK